MSPDTYHMHAHIKGVHPTVLHLTFTNIVEYVRPPRRPGPGTRTADGGDEKSRSPQRKAIVSVLPRVYHLPGEVPAALSPSGKAREHA